MSEQITYMNKPDRCLACMKKPEKVEGNIKVNGVFKKVKVPLIKHHVRYDPEMIGYVHFDCHQIIHDENDPRYKHLIQFQDGESREYYDNKRN
jgi:hypothetical protein